MWKIHYPALSEACLYLKDVYHIWLLDQLSRGIQPIGYDGSVDHTSISYANSHIKYIDKTPEEIAEQLISLWNPITFTLPFSKPNLPRKPSMDVMFYEYGRRQRWNLSIVRRYRIQYALKMLNVCLSPGQTSIRHFRLKRWKI